MNVLCSAAASGILNRDHLLDLAQADSAGEQKFAQAVGTVKTEQASYSGKYRDSDGAVVAFVKCYRPLATLNRLAVSLSLARPYRVFRVASRLAKDFSVPQPLALVRNKRSLNVYYFSQYIDGQSLAERVSASGEQLGDIEAVMRATGQCLAGFHRRGWLHGDFKWTNILLAEIGAARHEEFYFIDLDAVTRLARPGVDRGRDIARFLVNGEDNGTDAATLQFFLQGYAAGMNEPVNQSVAAAEPALHKLRQRHSDKYGAPSSQTNYSGGATGS